MQIKNIPKIMDACKHVNRFKQSLTCKEKAKGEKICDASSKVTHRDSKESATGNILIAVYCRLAMQNIFNGRYVLCERYLHLLECLYIAYLEHHFMWNFSVVLLKR